MAINKEINIMKNITFTKETAEKVQQLAEAEHRSFSKQVAYMVDKWLEEERQK
jgi:hypothetical protein